MGWGLRVRVKYKRFHNTRENTIKTLFKAPDWELQAFISAYLAPRLLLILVLITATVTLSVKPAESKKLNSIDFGLEQTINIFPTEVETVDWAGVESVLIQELSDNSLYQDFSARNSAYVPQTDDFTQSPVQSQPTLSSPSVSETEQPTPVDLQEQPVQDAQPTTSSEQSVVEPDTDTTAATQTDPVPETIEQQSTPAEPDTNSENLPDEEEFVEEEAEVIEPPAEPEPQPVEEAIPDPEPASEPLSLLDSAKTYVRGVFSKAVGLFPLAQQTVITPVETSAEQQNAAEESSPKTETVTDETETIDDELLSETGTVTEEQSLEPVYESPVVTEEITETTVAEPELEITPEVPEQASTTSSAPVETEPATDVIVSPDVSTEATEVAIEPETESKTVHEITLKNFDTAPLEQGQFITGAQLRLSFAAQLETPASGTAPYVEVLFGKNDKLEGVGVILLEDEVSNAFNGGYYLFALPSFNNINQLNDVEVVLRYQGDNELLDGMFLDAAWVELDTRIITKDDLKQRGTADKLTHLTQPKLNTLVSTQVNFEREERPVFNLRYASQRNALVRGVRNLIGSNLVAVESAHITHNSLGLIGVTPDINVTSDGLLTLEIPEDQMANMRPGTYEIELILNEGGKEFTDTFNFQWGVLSINPNKSEYESGETAQISIGALTPSGNTVCHTNLDLYITDPLGAVSKVPVNESGLCDGNNIIDVPDFSAVASTSEPGVHEMYLERLDDEGNVLSFTNDTFLVASAQKLSIERDGPTRIYPPSPYPMTLTVATEESFTGTLTERVPRDFVVTNTTADITINGDWQQLTWDISIMGAGTEIVSYDFDAPDLSPYLYGLGPASLVEDSQTKTVTIASTTASTTSQQTITVGGLLFTEHRQWQIASDAVGNMILFWADGATIPTDWTCLSCGSGTFFQRFAMGSSTYNSTGGAASHTPTASSSVLASGLSTTDAKAGTTIANTGHTHTLAPTIGLASNLPEYRQLRVIQYTAAAGEPTTIPAGAIGIFDVSSSSLPSGWNRYTAQDGKYVYGEDTPGTAAGSNTHTHTLTGTTGAAANGTQGNTGPDAADGAAAGHTHTINSSTASTSNEPPYIEVLLGQITSAAAPPNGLIAMWTEDVGTGWLDISSSPGDAFSNRFIKASTTYGGTGGGLTHTESDVTGITSSAPSAVVTTARAGSAGSDSTHTHSVSVTSFSTESNLPPYLTVVIGKRQGSNPVYNQSSSLWYVNENAQTPTDEWPSGVTDLVEREPITATSTPVKDGDEVRLRLNVGVTNATSSAGAEFKLQFSVSDICSSAPAWYDVGDTSSTTVWRGYNNAGVTDHSTLSTQLLASSTVSATYEENGYATTTPNDISVDDYGEWDFVLQQNGAVAGTNYCFRMVETDGTSFSTYSHYPQLFTNEAPVAPTLQKLFDNEKTPSSTPWFYFAATDAEGGKVHYEIEIDNNYGFGSPEAQYDTIDDSSHFENQVLTSDKAPFQQGELIRFIQPSSLATSTYYWHVRAQDPDGSGDWGEWSEVRSFTIDTTLSASAWFQTQDEQFDTNSLTGVETGSDQASLISGSSTGTMVSGAIDFSEGDLGTAWDSFVFNDTEGTGDIKYQIEYLDATDTWTLIPDSDLAGNSVGFDTGSPISLLALDTDVYNIIRLVANFTNPGAPSVQDWAIYWGYRVETPTIAKLFPNEQTGTTTPTFQFTTTDPQTDSLTYQVQWSSTPDFAASTTRTSDTAPTSSFKNIDVGTDYDPFNSGDDISFTIQPVDALTGTTTYWWRVRAKDTTGDDAYSFWTEPQSFTVIPGTQVSTWLQTTEEQFDSNVLSGTIALTSDAVSVATTATEAMVVYGEGTSYTPRYRQWDGTTWGSEGSLLSIGAPVKWSVVRAATTREEYVAVTVGTDADVNAQVFSTGVWDNLQEMTINMGNVSARGFDVAYETVSGNAVVAYCDATTGEAAYYTWDGSSWTSGGAITLGSANNCEWLTLSSDPVSNEIILMARDSVGTAAASYEVLVWNGATWGNSSTQGGARSSSYGTMALNYETSGGQAISVSGDGAPVRFEYNLWNGTAWAGNANNSTISDNLVWAELSRDPSSDALAMCYVDESVNIGAIRWTGTAWAGQTDLSTAGNSIADRSVSCSYDLSSNIIAAYSTTTGAAYQTWNGSAWSGEGTITGITDSATVQTIRTGEGKVLALFFDDVNDRLDFSSWNGSWSTSQTLETDMSVDTSPYGEPFMMAPRNSGSEGTTIVSPAVDFDDGTGPYWKTFSWNDSQPGTSQILYRLQYYTSTSSWAFIPDVDLPGNVAGTSTGPFDLSNLNTNTYNVIRPYAELSCDGSSNCPSINDWKIEWAGGITISGTAQQYDQSANVTSGTVAVAVNGVLQSGKTGTISGGNWSIGNVTAFGGDIITVFVTSAADANEAVAVARYDGQGDMDGVVLYERHLTLGSNDATTTPFTNVDIGQYDFTNTEDVFFDLNGTALNICADTGCSDAELYIKSGAYYTPGGILVTHDLENNGTFTAGAYTHELSGSWDNNATTTMTGSTVIFAATSTTESIDSTGAITSSFNNVTFGTTTGNGTWTLPTSLDVSGDLTVSRGTLARGTTSIEIAGNLTTEANGFWTGIGTTTFDGSTGKTWNDQNATKQNIGNVVVDGTSKIVTLAGDVAAESITIGANDTLDASATNYDITVYGYWLNQNNFLPRSGEVFFAATSSGQNITTAGDGFYDLTFTGVGGGWSFTESTVLINNDLTVATGTVNMPTATSTIAGSFDSTGGSFAHNNGVLYFTSAGPETITFDGGLFTNVAYNMTFNGGGSWTMNDTNATTTNDILVDQGTVTFPGGVLAIGGTLTDSGGTFNGGTGTTRFYSGVAEVLTAGGSSFNNIEFAGAGSWSFSDNDVDVNGDLFVTQGTLTLPTGTLTLGGSYDNNSTVTAGTGTVDFDSTDSGETVDFGNSALYNVVFDSPTGGWTISAPATTTNDFTLASSSDWTLAIGQVLSVGGIFTNNVGGASTTWTGSALSLEAGSYSINTKTDAGDSYATLDIAANTDIAMWNSVASVYQVDVTGSLYSQDHNAVDGDLYIFGEYINNQGDEYWSYATDFDGTNLTGGGERQVDVRFASGATAAFASSTVEILGTSTASTTIANQGAGTYTVAVSKGTTTAQYYEFSDLGSTGVSFLNSAIVSVLRDGSYEVAAPGGTGITLSSTTIDANPGKQIFNISFSTTTAIAANNVSQTDGVPASFWWFREGTGNLYGEAKDNDTGDPGSVRFDDSSLVITVSGTVYSDAGTTPIVGGTCDGVTPVVRVVVNGGASSTGSCSNIDGSYSIGGLVVIGDPTLTVYLDNASGGEQGSAITRTPTTDITDMDIYANRVIVRNEDTDPLSILNLDVFDYTDDTDLQFVTATTSYPDTLTLLSGNELFVFASSTFAPGGDIVLNANATANDYDGSLYIDDDATFTGAGTSTYTIGGRLVLDTGATFTSASTTVLMNATTTGKSITSPSEVTFYELTFDGVSGGWIISADIQVDGDMTITNGTVSGTGDITLPTGSMTGNGTLSLSGGTTTIASTNTLGGTSAWTFYNLQLGDTFVVGTTTPVFTSTTTVAGKLIIESAHYLDAGATKWDLSGTGTVFIENGTFIEDTSTIRYSGAGSNVLSTQYYNLDINASAGSPTYTATGLGMIVDGDLTIGGEANTTFDLTTVDPLLDVNGDVLIRSNGTLSASDSNDFTIAGSYDNNGTFISNGGTLTFDGAGTIDVAAGNSSFGNVLVDVTGDLTVSESATTTGTFILANANTFTLSSGETLAVGDVFFNAVGGADTTWTGSTLRLNSNSNFSLNAATTSDTYATLDIDGTTQVRMWNSDAGTYDVSATASLYSQDHSNTDGDLYIWGDYRNTAGADHWSYATDFDGTALGGSPRKVDVYLATSSSVSVTGGSLGVYGVASASTTIQNQGSGAYSLIIGGSASSSFNYYEIRDVDSDGLVLTGSPTIGTLSNGDLEVSQNGGTAITVGGTVITANPAKNFTINRFALNGVASGNNVTATGTTVSSWRFANHYGDIAGEAFDVDPNGDPGYVTWDDSAALITVSGNVYSDEGSTVSGVCDGATNNVTLRVAGITSYSTTCDASTGAYSITNVSYGSSDSLVVYIDNETPKGAAATKEPVSNINDLHIYENRVIVRHENVNPITIANMAVWDSSDDADIPFTAVDAGTDTLTLPADTKLLIWTGKEFQPTGDVTLSGGGAGAAYDGTLQLYSNATWSGQATELLSIGGSMILDTDATFLASNGTTTFTTTGVARTIDVNEDSFNNIALTGSGSWSLTDATLTVQGYYSQTAGTVTFPTGTSTFYGSLINSGGTFDANGGYAYFTDTGSKTITLGGSDLATVEFTEGNYVFGDTNATTTGSTTITSGSVTLPSGVFAVGGDFFNVGGSFTHNTVELAMTNATSAAVLASSSDLYGVTFNGGGAYAFSDDSLTLLDSLYIVDGDVILASGTLSIGGSFDNAGTFDHASGTLLFNSADGGEFIDAGVSDFYNVQISSPTGGYSLLANATTTNNFVIASANSFTAQSGVVLTVNGVFQNSVGGANTTWSGSTLKLDGANAYSVNTKASGGDQYDTLTIGADSDIRFWNSAATTTLVDVTSSVYSQDHAATNGALYVFGDFHIGTTTEYWSYATDFDGADLSGSERVVTVSHATSATTTVDGGSLQIIGTSGNETTITNQGSDTYAMAVNAGTLNAQYYKFRNLNSAGLNLSGTPTITSLSYGDYELAVNNGTLISLASSTLNANASKVIVGNRFATTTAITGKNITFIGTTSNAWTFVSHTGNLDGEDYDVDGATACGSIRWSDSSCLLTQQTNFRWRNDDGGEGVPASEWYDVNWDARKQVRIDNADTSAYTDAAVQLFVAYDSDMQTDFDDLRFTDSSGTTSIPYWIGSSTNSAVAEVWVKVPSLPAEEITPIFMYYNNPTATTTSSSTQVFIAADDFEDNNISEYSGQTSLFSTGTNFNFDGTYGLDNAGNESSRANLGGIYRFDQTVSQGETFRFWQYVDTSAGSGDEPCVLFGVQSPGSTNENYAVCLEQFGTDRISLVEDVVDSEGSGTVLASSTVTYSTGWYEVEVDWGTDDSMFVSLYTAAGTLAATTSATDSTYTSGGYGFTFWFHNGGWDSVSSRPTLTNEPTIYFGVEQIDGGATWKADLNTGGIYNVDDKARLRLSIENSGLAITNKQFLLEYAARGASPSCEAVDPNDYAAVPVQSSCGTSPVCMQSSTHVTNGGTTVDLLTNVKGTFTPGEVREDPSNITGNLNIGQNEYNELEYVITPTSNVVDGRLCFRVTENGTDLDTYLQVAEMLLKFDPVVGAITLNNGQNISLVPGTTTLVYATGTVSDYNGFADLTIASSTIYRSGVVGGASCTADNNNCYISSTPSTCQFTNCSGDSCTVECQADIFFHADPTDVGSIYDGQEWLAFIEVEDASAGYDFGSAPGVEMSTLRAIDVNGLIDYGAIAVNSDTGSFNASTSVLNQGNVEIDLEIIGTDLSDGASSLIPAEQQKFATSTFTYSACGASCDLLSSTTPVGIDVDLAKPSVDSPPVEDDVYWGIAIPIGVNSVAHQGVNVFTPVSP